MKKQKLVVLRGRPTSGKSTAYANLRKKKIMEDWFFVDHCALKKWLGKEFGKKALFAILKILIPNKKNIIIEEMSIETINKYLKSYIERYCYKIIVFQFTVKTKTDYKRDIKRAKDGWHPFMGKKKIKEMHDMHDERFDKKALLVDCDKLGKRQVVDFILKKLNKK